MHRLLTRQPPVPGQNSLGPIGHGRIADIERSTPRLAGGSVVAILRLAGFCLFGLVLEKPGGRTRARTWDPMIKSLTLMMPFQ